MASIELEVSQRGDGPATEGPDAPALQIARLYEQHHRMIRALCQLLLRNPVDAEDAAQQTFLSAFGSLIDGTVPRQPAAWLATIARRECWARTAQRRQQPLALDETNAPASADNPLEEAIRNVDLAALWRAIDDLPRQQRNAFLMREFSGLSYAEVAEALGATESAIESLLVRARRQLRDGLDQAIAGANLLATPILLLQHRLGRLLGGRQGGGASAIGAGIPVIAKIGATVAGVAAVGSAGVGAAVLVSHPARHHSAHPESVQGSAPVVAAGAGPLDRLIGRALAGEPFPLPLTRKGRRLGLSLLDPRNSVSSTRTGDGPAPAQPSSVATATPTPTDSTAPDAPADGSSPAPDTTPPDGAVTDTNASDPSVPDTGAIDTSPTDTTATDTTPVDTTPTDTSSADVTQPDPTTDTTTDPSAP